MTKGEPRFMHAGDLSTNDALALEWVVGSTGWRFQEIAIAGNKVVGSWRYDVSVKGQKWLLESDYTEVAKRFQRRGIALGLWMHGIARWRPVKSIKATIGSNEGKAFLAHVNAELAFTDPDLWLNVQVGKDDLESWNQYKEWAAENKLRALGRLTPTQKKPLKLLAGGSS